MNTIRIISTKRKLITLFFLFFCFLQSITVTAQSDSNYQTIIDKVKQFSKPAKILNKHIDATGNGSVEFTNAKKQVLRFRLQHQQLQVHPQLFRAHSNGANTPLSTDYKVLGPRMSHLSRQSCFGRELAFKCQRSNPASCDGKCSAPGIAKAERGE